ncbi:hypothetical protein JHK85_012083 [Glycine max]|nr:hypothetical protein JHK85_012083 [Glycine max]
MLIAEQILQECWKPSQYCLYRTTTPTYQKLIGQSVLTDVPRYPNGHLAFNNQHSHHKILSNARVGYDETTPAETEGGEVVDVERDQCTNKKIRVALNCTSGRPIGLKKLIATSLVCY